MFTNNSPSRNFENLTAVLKLIPMLTTWCATEGLVLKIKMANTGVLPFVRGVDFTKNDFSVSILWICSTLFYG